jgi:DNA-3-methyladenine glycosylase II
MKWIDHESYIEIFPPREFNFQECLVFLGRSDQEVLHQIKDGYIYKLIKVNQELILLKIGSTAQSIQVEFPINTPSLSAREEMAAYIWEWFDLDRNLVGFYEMSSRDEVLKFAHKYYGLRIMCIPDLFEALTWAIIGQQINLTFAYTLKKRFVEQFGERLTFLGDTFWIYPSFQKIASIEVDDLRKLQFTSRKAEYVIGVAKAMTNGELTKEALLQKQDYPQIQKSLMAIRGIGAWTADYVMMKCLHHPSAFPIADVGLHNALKIQLGLDRKPKIEEIKEMAKNWEGWQAYATFYLWRSLYE